MNLASQERTSLGKAGSGEDFYPCSAGQKSNRKKSTDGKKKRTKVIGKPRPNPGTSQNRSTRRGENWVKRQALGNGEGKNSPES